MSTYARFRDQLEDGDVLLFASKGRVAGFIRRATRSRYSHAAVCVRIEERVMVAESREGRGVRLVNLSDVLGAGRVDVFKPEPWIAVNRQAVKLAALERLGGPYGWMTILRHGLAWALVVLPARWLGRVPLVGAWLEGLQTYSEDDLEDPGRALVCSTFVAWCYRQGGADLVRQLSDRYTTPGDLARSLGLRFHSRLER